MAGVGKTVVGEQGKIVGEQNKIVEEPDMIVEGQDTIVEEPDMIVEEQDTIVEEQRSLFVLEQECKTWRNLRLPDWPQCKGETILQSAKQIQRILDEYCQYKYKLYKV